jgi:hypothetical protein
MIGAKARNLSQRQRRMLVLVEYAGLSAYAVVWMLASATSPWWWTSVIFAFVVTVLIHSRLLVPFTQEIANKGDDDLDERQTAVRDNAHRTAYHILGTVVLGALFLLWVILEPLGDRPWTPEISIENPTAVFVMTLWVYITLPTAVIAWREPGTDPDE